jgi:hypothetical protein
MIHIKNPGKISLVENIAMINETQSTPTPSQRPTTRRQAQDSPSPASRLQPGGRMATTPVNASPTDLGTSLAIGPAGSPATPLIKSSEKSGDFNLLITREFLIVTLQIKNSRSFSVTGTDSTTADASAESTTTCLTYAAEEVVW